MSEPLNYQIRINLNDDFAERARRNPSDPVLKPLADVLARHDATMKSLYDAFAEYVSGAEKHGIEKFPLYQWTKAAIDDPAKKARHVKVFPLYVKGNEVYAKALADALEADLQPLVGGAIVAQLSRLDTNPANNPQVPDHYR